MIGSGESIAPGPGLVVSVAVVDIAFLLLIEG
jgi:hypothetical protein